MKQIRREQQTLKEARLVPVTGKFLVSIAWIVAFLLLIIGSGAIVSMLVQENN